MNVISKILKLFKKSYIPYSDIRTKFSSSEISSISSWLVLCLDVRARNVSYLKDVLFVNGKEAESHYLNKILELPDAVNNLTWGEFKRVLVYQLDLYGNAIIKIDRKGTKVYNLLILPFSKIRFEDGIGGFRIYYNNVLQNLDDIIHIKSVGMDGGRVGVPILRNAVSGIEEIDKQLINAVYKTLKTDSVPPLAIVNKRELGLTPAEFERLQGSIRDNMPDLVPKVLLDGVEVVPLVTRTQVTNFVEGGLNNEIRKRIAALFGIPDSLLTSEFDNRAAATQIYHNFYKATIEPLNALILNEISTGLRRVTREDVKLYCYGYEDTDQEFKLNETVQLVQSGIITADEARQLYGYKPLGSTSTVSKFKSYQNDFEYWVKNVSIIDKYNELLAAGVVRLIKEFESYVLLHFESVPEKAALFTEFSTETFIRQSEQYQKLSDTTLKAIDEFFEFARTQTGGLEGLEIDKQRIAYEFNQKITDSINTIEKNLKTKIREIVADNIELEFQEQLKKLIKETKSSFSQYYTKARAKAIIQTTYTHVNGAVQRAIADKTGKKPIWICSFINSRDTHVAVHGKTPNIDGYFRVGNDLMRHPGGGSSAEENVNCRCVLKLE